jgi:hypothetical protein
MVVATENPMMLPAPQIVGVPEMNSRTRKTLQNQQTHKRPHFSKYKSKVAWTQAAPVDQMQGVYSRVSRAFDSSQHLCNAESVQAAESA